MIHFDNVTKTYPNQSRPALENVTLDVEKGEYVFLVGPDNPERYGANCLVFWSYRTNSPRRLEPMKKTFVPSLFGSGDCELICPTVSCTGSGLTFRHSSPPSAIAHRFDTPSRVD